MIPRQKVVEMASELNKENPTQEALLLSMILHVLLDIRDQNNEMLERQCHPRATQSKVD